MVTAARNPATAPSSRRRPQAKRASGNSAGTQATSTRRCGFVDGPAVAATGYAAGAPVRPGVWVPALTRDRPAGARGAGMTLERDQSARYNNAYNREVRFEPHADHRRSTCDLGNLLSD